MILISNIKENNNSFVKFLQGKGVEAKISNDKCSYFNGTKGGNELSDLWDEFYCTNPVLLSANNICITKVKQYIASDGSIYVSKPLPRGSYDIKWAYQIVSRYNYTPQSTTGKETSFWGYFYDLEKALKELMEIALFNFDLKPCCSFSLLTEKLCAEYGIHPW